MSETAHTETLGQPVQGEDEDYVDYLTRKSDWYSDHPPTAPAGFHLLECAATPRHSPTYEPIDEDFYPGACHYCQMASDYERHAPCAHKGHGRWRRWKASKRIVSWLSLMGPVAAHGVTYSAYCRGCITGVQWASRKRRPLYLLGLKWQAWQCLRQGHRRREDGYGFCSTCFPDLDA